MTIKPRFLALAIGTLLALPAAARTPTNDAAAFKTFGLYTDRTSSANTYRFSGSSRLAITAFIAAALAAYNLAQLTRAK